MSEVLKDNGWRLKAALEIIHGKQVSDIRLMMIADELIAHRFEQSDPDAFDERMNRYLVKLDTAVHQSDDQDARHTLFTLAIMNMIPSITVTATVETQATDDILHDDAARERT